MATKPPTRNYASFMSILLFFRHLRNLAKRRVSRQTLARFSHPQNSWNLWIMILHVHPWLVGGLNPSEKYEFVNWDDDIPNISGTIQNSWQPVTTNQLWKKPPTFRESPAPEEFPGWLVGILGIISNFYDRSCLAEAAICKAHGVFGLVF